MKKQRPFDSLQKDLRQQRHQTHEICRQFNRSPSKGHLKKLKSLFAHCGENVLIEQGFHCDYGNKITLGSRVYLNINCVLLDGGAITLGDDCLIGPNVQILTINHDISPQARLTKTNYAKDVNIEHNVWIGAGSIILPGTTIYQGSVIGAGSVVTGSVEPNALYCGNPAKKLKNI